MKRVNLFGDTAANLVRCRRHQLETAEGAIGAGRGCHVSPIAEVASRSVEFRKPSGKGVLPIGGSMFIRSIRLFSVRISVRVAKVSTPRYRMFFSYLEEDCEFEYDTLLAGNSLRLLLKELSEVAEHLCLKFAKDVRVVVKDMDYDGCEIESEIRLYQPLRILEVPKAISLGRVKLK